MGFILRDVTQSVCNKSSIDACLVIHIRFTIYVGYNYLHMGVVPLFIKTKQIFILKLVHISSKLPKILLAVIKL